jgi:hypothetical protein
VAGSTKDAWDQVGENFSKVGRRLAERYRSLAAERGAESTEDQEKVKAALRAVTEQLDRAFTSLGDTIRDQEAQAGLRQAVGSLGDALSTTFSEAAERIRSRGTSDQPPPPPDQAS